MTAAQLLLWVIVALLLQVAFGIVVAVTRRRRTAMVATVAPPVADPRLHAAWPGWREFRVVRREYEDSACSQCSFYLEPVDGQALPGFRPGQFLTFALDVAVGLDGCRTITRCCSLSDRPDPDRYRITVKRIAAPRDRPQLPPGLSSSHFHDAVREGCVLKVKAPSGHFFIDPESSMPVVLVGGGIGITPMMSMLQWCLAEQPTRTVHLYYGVRDRTEHAFKAALEALATKHATLHLNVVYSHPAGDDVPGRDYHHRGHVDVGLLRRTLPHGRSQFYVCGPPAMMQTLVPALAAWGVPRADLHFEAFGPASVKLPGDTVLPPAGKAPLEIRFQRSGRTLSWDHGDESLLEFAERHGLVLESGCRSGGCGTCQTRLLEGKVHYAHAPDHDVAPGHCLLCVGRPASPMVLEA